MRTERDVLILEGAEVFAYRALTNQLLNDKPLFTAAKRLWKRYPSLDKLSRGAVAAGALRTLSAFVIMRAMKPEASVVVLVEEARDRAQVLLNSEAPITHNSTAVISRPMVKPDPFTGVAQISGRGRLHGRFRLAGPSALLKLD